MRMCIVLACIAMVSTASAQLSRPTLKSDRTSAYVPPSKRETAWVRNFDELGVDEKAAVVYWVYKGLEFRWTAPTRYSMTAQNPLVNALVMAERISQSDRMEWTWGDSADVRVKQATELRVAELPKKRYMDQVRARAAASGGTQEVEADAGD